MSTCLIKPNGAINYAKSLETFRALEPPLWLLALASKCTNPHIIDAELDNLNSEEVYKKAKQLKCKKAIIVSTGSHPSSYFQVKDEMLKIAAEFSRHDIPVKTYDTLPINPIGAKLDWSLLELRKYRAHNWHGLTGETLSPYAVTYSSLSCMMKCNFCATKRFFGSGYRIRPIKDLLADLDYFSSYGIKNVKLMDEIFVTNETRIKEVCQAIANRHYNFNIWVYARIDGVNPRILELMRSAGIRWVAYGIESGNEKIRHGIQKGNFSNDKIRQVIDITKKADICIIGNYMFGFWEDSKETMAETLSLAQELNTEYINFYCLNAFPGTEFYDYLIKKGINVPKSGEEFSQVSEYFKPIPTKYMKGKDVLEFRDTAFQKYMRNESYLTMFENKFGTKALEKLSKLLHAKINRMAL